ncbi:MAG: NB-ARC domain-containing protein, partial [Delftia sp.]|nr:NB-ARC domain-containing protein [Delftia sp.]
MDERETLQQTLEMAQAVLAVLEKQSAGYTSLTIPAHIQIQLDEKRQEVASLQTRLDQLQGRATDRVDNLQRPPAMFVGRKQESARCLDALSPEERGWGVTIDGIGGIGKTALALEVAQRAKQQAWFDAYLYISAKTTWYSAQGVRQETLAQTSLDAFVREFIRLLGHMQERQITEALARRKALLDALRGRR